MEQILSTTITITITALPSRSAHCHANIPTINHHLIHMPYRHHWTTIMITITGGSLVLAHRHHHLHLLSPMLWLCKIGMPYHRPRYWMNL
jgi:hypothetical protein